MEYFEIRGEFIKLGQLLKAAGIVDSGAYAKIIILNGEVCVNGETIFQRGKKIVKGDIVEVGENKIIIR